MKRHAEGVWHRHNSHAARPPLLVSPPSDSSPGGLSTLPPSVRLRKEHGSRTAASQARGPGRAPVGLPRCLGTHDAAGSLRREHLRGPVHTRGGGIPISRRWTQSLLFAQLRAVCHSVHRDSGGLTPFKVPGRACLPAGCVQPTRRGGGYLSGGRGKERGRECDSSLHGALPANQGRPPGGGDI